jgi:hypothetical protein
MRDLAKRQYSNRSSPRAKFQLPLKLLLIIVLVLSVVGFAKSRFGVSSAASSESLHDAPYGLKPIEAVDIDVTSGGVNLTTQKAILSDVKYGGRAKGTATRSFGGGSYILSVDVTIPETTGAAWEVWLVDSEGALREVDFMNCSGKTCSYTLRDTDKFSSFNNIWITRELTKEDNAPEQHVLEGGW